MTLPWDYSEAPRPGEPTTPNVRSPEGAALGREIARLYAIEEPAQLARFPRMLPRCDDCAARLGTLPNECAESTMDLVKCAIEGEPFYCHKGLREGEDPKRLCTGWLVLASGETLARFAARGAR